MQNNDISEFTFEKWCEPHFRPVNKFYKSQQHKGKANGEDVVFVIWYEGELVGAVRLVPYDHFYWLRSLYIKEALRGKGLGLELLNFVKRSLEGPFKKDIHCFPYEHLQSFYSLGGYRLSDSQLLPETLTDLYLKYLSRGERIIAMSLFKAG